MTQELNSCQLRSLNRFHIKDNQVVKRNLLLNSIAFRKPAAAGLAHPVHLIKQFRTSKGLKFKTSNTAGKHLCNKFTRPTPAARHVKQANAF